MAKRERTTLEKLTKRAARSPWTLYKRTWDVWKHGYCQRCGVELPAAVKGRGLRCERCGGDTYG